MIYFSLLFQKKGFYNGGEGMDWHGSKSRKLYVIVHREQRMRTGSGVRP